MPQKKIAILTQPLKSNYGGSMQNFALSFLLHKSGYEVETINRIDENPHSKIKRLFSQLKHNFLRILGLNKAFTKIEKDLIYQNHQIFLKNEINLSAPLETTKELKEYFIKKQFDAVIVGSDQTWRPIYSPNIYNYFLDFLKDDKSIKKLAYASSFGTDRWEYNEQETELCQKLIQNFNFISVREDSGIDLCNKYLKINATEVLDPTLLLTKDDYLKLINDEKQTRQGIFTYILDQNPHKENIINLVSKELGLKIFSNQPKSITSNKVEDRIYPSVYGWINAFNEADFIVTDSFHGTVFSIIFNKPFITIINKERGASRFYSLLRKFNLEDRLIDTDSDKNTVINIIKDKLIDYKGINSNLEILRLKSIQLLLSNLK